MIKATVVDKEGHQLREPRNHVYLKFTPFGMTKRDELELVVEFYNKNSKQNVVDYVKLKANKKEERIYLRKMLKTKKAIDYGKSNSMIKYLNVAIGVRKWFNAAAQKDILDEYDSKRKELAASIDKSDCFSFSPGLNEFREIWQRTEELILHVANININYDE